MTITPTFSIPSGSFLGIGKNSFNSKFVIAGIPLDIGVTGRAGTREGPAAIRLASRNLTDGAHPVSFVDYKNLDISDIGNFSISLGDVGGSLSLIEEAALGVAGNLICLGGEHGITLPLLRAKRSLVGVPLALVHFDAHCDTWPDSFGLKYGHGNFLYHAINEGLVDPQKVIQIGVRSPVSWEVFKWGQNIGITSISVEKLMLDNINYFSGLIRNIIGEIPAYLTLDIDCLDPAFAPGTGTPEIGGLSSFLVQRLIRNLFGINFVGMDVVEVAPAYDISEITSLAAATFVWEYICLIGSKN